MSAVHDEQVHVRWGYIISKITSPDSCVARRV